MAINKNHLFDDLNGVKCAIVESDISLHRAEFLKQLLELNSFTVVMIPFVSTKKTVVVPDANASAEAPAVVPETFTVGVTDVTFNSTNAIFGRLLKSKDGSVVTMAYWQQKESVSNDHVPYFDSKI
ncbi:MAG: hypothetical protein IPP71_00175 [Bacteroidetes bacterium]|nr:hypothetical protein [Bacteroidota bacterium]